MDGFWIAFSVPSPDSKSRLAHLVREAVRAAFPEAGEVEIELDRPKNPEHGDLTTNVALQLAKRVGRKPREAAEAIVAALGRHAEIARAEISGPGDAAGDDLEAIRKFAVAYLRKEQDEDLRAFGVRFDSYFLESSLYTDGAVEETVRMLREAGHTYESEGALWLRTTEFGDDKDRVMRKSDGTYTYFVPDVAYPLGKFRRGYDNAVNVQGSDHHSTVTRVRAGLQALEAGIPRGYPDYVLHQMVTVMKGGEEMKISKRAGSYVTVRDLIDEAGRAALRYLFAVRPGHSPPVLD